MFYYESSRDKSTYEHPCDGFYSWMYSGIRAQAFAARRIQRAWRRYLTTMRSQRRLVRQTVRAIRLPVYVQPSGRRSRTALLAGAGAPARPAAARRRDADVDVALRRERALRVAAERELQLAKAELAAQRR